MNLLTIYEKLEAVLKKLPEGLHQPILREIEPIKTLFLQQRPPRLMLLGDRSVSRAAILNALYGSEILRATEDVTQSGGWDQYSASGRGRVTLLDARLPIGLPVLSRPIGAEPADLYLFVRGAKGIDEGLAADLDHAAAVVALADGQYQERPKILGLQVGNAAGEDQRLELHGVLFTKPSLAERTLGALLLSARDKAVEQIAIELPGSAQLEMARVSQIRSLQHQIAGVVVKSVSAICGAIGAQPIPLADFPILTSLQGSMVASIAHVSGREFNAKLAAEFLGALGANIGAGLVLREGARAAAKLIPGWGNAISGGVAAAGTYAIGRAAVAYFIDGVSLADARSIFRRRGKPAALLK
ncbi:MAG TPA: hypothetical protein VFG14_15425 [Chthoniobacteraceae bacterium]|jgi:uncharacterized protein (DUF697 family)|nr:hypothetical protein [Chthoniobacteraceae bacterium]